MSEPEKHYSLQLLFDGQQLSKEELEQKATKRLSEHLSEIDLDVKVVRSQVLQLTLTGKLETIDSCHDKLNELAKQNSKLQFKRLLDEVGDEIRLQAYPILSAIEQRFRAFINQALIEVAGFDWWHKTIPDDLRNKAQSISQKHEEKNILLDPLECTQFDDLITIITAESSEWKESQTLSVNDLTELLSDCESVSKIKEKIQQKTRKIAFWDDIFAKYFQNEDEWKRLKKALEGVIKQRHKVMHHRPIRLGVVKNLLSKKKEIFALLDAAKPELSENERSEAKHAIQDYCQTIGMVIKGSQIPQVLNAAALLDILPVTVSQVFQDMALRDSLKIPPVSIAMASQVWQEHLKRASKIIQDPSSQQHIKFLKEQVETSEVNVEPEVSLEEVDPDIDHSEEDDGY